MSKKRVMVDMSATIIHHGHVRILKQASDIGDVVVGLTSDEEILNKKGYKPELSFEERKEILESFKYVYEVVETPWLIDDVILNKHKIDILMHGDDNTNNISKDRLEVLPRTKDISSSKMRLRAQKSITQIKNQKLMLTPGPAVVLHENLENLKPLFGRGDDEYTEMSKKVVDWIKALSGQDEVIMAQGSATFALELGLHTFVSGKVLLISTGYYSDRLEKLLPRNCKLSICKYDELDDLNESYDWVLCAYTETSVAFKVNLKKIREISNKLNAKLFVDATGSIGLEDNHDLADLTAFSSCKGLFGLTGACFVAFKNNLSPKQTNNFYFNLDTHKNKMVTGPYHPIASLYGVMENHNIFRQRVINSKNYILDNYKELVRQGNQPLLCTYLEAEIVPKDENVIMYSPRSELSGSVICHFGEIHHDQINLGNKIEVVC